MINFIILGAGKGTRMNSDIPKVLHKVCDKTLLQICVDLCDNFKNKSNKIIAVVSENMMQNFNDLLPKNVDFVIQTEQLGTGHAVKYAIPKIDQSNPYTIVIYGDHVLLKFSTIKRMIETLENFDAVVLGFILSEKNKYGKLITTQNQLNAEPGMVFDLIKIKEAKEFLSEEIQPTICNSGLLGFKTDKLIENIGKIDNNNVSGEYYLTDMIWLINSDQKNPVSCALVVENEEVLGINTQEELEISEKILLSRRA